MYKDVITATYMDGYKIAFVFEDGAKGTVDFSNYASMGGVFEKFKDMKFFKSFKINRELGTITWAGVIDIAPETLYAKATGTKLPPWMDVQENTSKTPLQHV